MGSQRPTPRDATVMETRAYIADMVGQLARMADGLGDRETAEAMRQAVARYAAAPATVPEAHP